ncbi:MAG: response regulator [Candidatus Taylorbacteria bacterium]|nr:response regulator [Candidatus Taylorbacteria bacterium]
MADDNNGKKRILVVDDDEFLLNMYAIKLKNSGYLPEVVTSAAKALEKLKGGSKYEAIVFDIVMPTMTGFEMVEEIKKQKFIPNCALIALTNQGQQADIDRGKALGIDGYIVKASSIPSEVVKEIGTILEAKKQ